MADSDEGVARSQADLRFTREFVQNLADDGVVIRADKKELAMLVHDLESYDAFKNRFMALLANLETEIFEKQTHQAIEQLQQAGTVDAFQHMRLEITRHPIYDKATYRRIQAFVWIFNAYDLLETGIIPENSPFSVD